MKAPGSTLVAAQSTMLEHGRGPGLSRPRLLWLDAARTLALAGMIVFHLIRDLELFGVLQAGTTQSGGLALSARIIAGSFLFFSGMSLILAHQSRFRAGAYAKRLLVIVLAALGVTLATFVVFPERFVFFGILHAVAFASLAGVVVLRAPFWLTGGLALGVLAVEHIWGGGLVHTPWLAWTGLSSVVPPSLDFIPVVPWIAAFLAGMATAQALQVSQVDLPIPHNRTVALLTWPGRHSLVVYLVHQPVLIGLVWLYVGGPL
ncbi:heparan-alpha-glucosaminide N-acetyltransferase [Thalassococcus sp. BH17M4-6]|uniref:heparan-alpha-glucosaminide N-acetyltransferase n=1 Tax=Thalassococcus sp. BH17M4-6 TaxID=3413148 RepID=UPI003BDFAF5F